MQSKLISLSALAVALTPVALAETREFPVDDFSRIVVEGGIVVNYATGPAHSVQVEQTDGDFSDIDISVSNGKLMVDRVSLGKNGWGWNRSMSSNWKNGELVVKVNGKRVPSYTVTVTSPQLDAVKAAQSSRLAATGVNAEMLKASASSSAEITLSGEATQAVLGASSSGTLDAAQLVAANLELDASSSGELHATSNSGDTIDIEASSSGDVKLTTTGNPDITISASSSADVILEGTCNYLEASISSSADVSGKSMACRTAEISASSGGDLSLAVSDSVIARASSGGDINISGSPAQRDVSRSSGGDVDFTG